MKRISLSKGNMLRNVTATDHEKYLWESFSTEIIEMNATDRADMVAAPEQAFVIAVYSALLITGALGNVGVFASLMKSRRRKSRVNLLMTHLVIADMMVTFVVIPLEVRYFLYYKLFYFARNVVQTVSKTEYFSKSW